ncbi:hypothetical protein HLH33_19200 [Gluconacetobacter diazotrophicus]|uniref:Uncharacterized protein n=1 Tax=Gluconacetobacter diazotrophicus TaxID=33996 RepID=A0A7W4I8X5_GLUDI|nr:hypothetical protein [Gluconacetobacter diazotrophicus]MBB2158390.1 hypothetical protein [Gluconacetobacter diazotrophicus]
MSDPEILALATPDWITTRVTVRGPADALARFRAAARGPGLIPWLVDWDYEETRLLAPMAPHGPAARTLARLLRQAGEARALRARAQTGCPFDLQRLVPVPAPILQLGEEAPSARRWLWEHWGTTWPLRQVTLTERAARRRDSVRLEIGFVSADWTPWRALQRIRADWPGLAFTVHPVGDGA